MAHIPQYLIVFINMDIFCFVFSNGNSCQLKAADLLATQKQYKKAVEIYEKVASVSMNDLGKWSVREYFFKAILCILAEEEKV